MPADYHLHTFLCKHAEGGISEYVESAREKRLHEICFADHAPAPSGYDPKNRMEIDQFPIYTKLVRELSNPALGGNQSVAAVADRGPRPAVAATDIYPKPVQFAAAPPREDTTTVFFGIEADYYQGCEEFLTKWLREQKFDLVIGSIHYIESWAFDNLNEREMWDSVDVTDTWREYFKLVQTLAATGLFDVVGHLDLPKKFGYRPHDRDLKEMAQPALDHIAAAGMGLEINTSGLRKPAKEIYPSPLLLALAREREIPICFGSDAHAPQDVGYAFDKALGLAQQAGYTHCLRFRQREKELIPLP